MLVIDPVITNYLINNKNIRYSGVTKLNQAEQWDIHHEKQSTDLRVTAKKLSKEEGKEDTLQQVLLPL